MIEDLLSSVSGIYIAYGVTDFRKQIYALCDLVESKYGFVLAQKTLLNADKMKFKWPKDKSEMSLITKKQLNWLLSGLSLTPQKAFKNIEINSENIAI